MHVRGYLPGDSNSFGFVAGGKGFEPLSQAPEAYWNRICMRIGTETQKEGIMMFRFWGVLPEQLLLQRRQLSLLFAATFWAELYVFRNLLATCNTEFSHTLGLRSWR